jgi:hypothetical protein
LSFLISLIRSLVFTTRDHRSTAHSIAPIVPSLPLLTNYVSEEDGGTTKEQPPQEAPPTMAAATVATTTTAAATTTMATTFSGSLSHNLPRGETEVCRCP